MRFDGSPILSDDEEDILRELSEAGDLPGADNRSDIDDSQSDLPNDRALLRLSDQLQAYLDKRADQTPGPRGSAHTTDGVTSESANQNPNGPPPQGSASGLASKWDSLTVTPFVVQPEHSANKGRKQRSLASSSAATAFMHAVGLTEQETDDVLGNAQIRKSGESRRCIDNVINEISWPHEKVRRLMGQHAGYKDLSFQEFIAGSLTVLSQSLPLNTVFAPIKAQLDYWVHLALDAHEHPWELVQASHKEVLISLEQGTLNINNCQAWHQLRRDTLLRLKNTDSFVGPNDAPANQTKGKRPTPASNGPSVQYCRNYNNVSCKVPDDHTGKNGVRWLHICSFCYTKQGNKCKHSALNCDAKKLEVKVVPKNEKGGPKQN